MITIRQNSTSPNIGNSNLVHAVTSNSSSEAQYRFVADVNDNTGTLLQRVKQQPNPNDTGVFPSHDRAKIFTTCCISSRC